MSEKPTAVVTGVTGQDGSILAGMLTSRGYRVYGLVRRRSDAPNLGCAESLKGNPDFEVVQGDLTDQGSLLRLCKLARPSRFFNAAAQSHVGNSFDEPVHTAMATGIGPLNCLEAIRASGFHTRFLQCSSSEMVGGNEKGIPADESVPFAPRSPYACAKLFAHHIVATYRSSYRMFASTAVSYNHEEAGIRGANFVTRKITLGIKSIVSGKADSISLGNIDARRDWSLASDVCRGMLLVLDHAEPDDFVFASGETHSVREFLQIAFDYAGLGDYEKFVKIDPSLFRPSEVHVLLGDSSKARRVLGWSPTVDFKGLVQRMVDYDLGRTPGTGLLHSGSPIQFVP